MYVDKAFQTEIDNLAVKCANNERGCKWSATLAELTVSHSHSQSHLHTIDKVTVSHTIDILNVLLINSL